MKKNLASFGLIALSLFVLGLPLPARAANTTQQITIESKAFRPPVIMVPANQKIKITITNNDNEAAEFESHQLNREKVVPAHQSVTLYVGPLEPGTYPFFNDFDPSMEKARGKIIVKAADQPAN